MNEQNSDIFVDNIYTNPISISSYIRRKHLSTQLRYHSGYKLFFILRGSVIFFVEDKEVYLKKNQFLIIPPFAKHRSIYTEFDKTLRCEIQFSPEYLDSEILDIITAMEKNSIVWELPQQYTEQLQFYFTQMNIYQKSPEFPHTPLMLKTLFTSVSILLSHHSVSSSGQEIKNVNNSVKQAIEFINENYYKNITPRELAENMFISERTLYRLFKDNISLTVTEYINYVRIINAERLMADDSLSITDIAYHCGFNDSSYFSTVFKKYTGISPRFYRLNRLAAQNESNYPSSQ